MNSTIISQDKVEEIISNVRTMNIDPLRSLTKEEIDAKYDEILNVGIDGTITPEQLEEILKSVSVMDNSPQTKIMRNILENKVDRSGESTEIIEKVEQVMMEENGEVSVVNHDDLPGYADKSISEYTEDGGIGDSYTEENLKKSIGTYNLEDADILEVLKIVNRVKAGEKFSIYNAFPDSLKTLIDVNCGHIGMSTKQQKQLAAKMMIDDFINEANMDKEFMDFNESMQKELDIPNIIDMYSDHIKDVMEVELLAKADIVTTESPEKAELLREISRAFTDSYNFNKIIESLEANKKFTKKLTQEADKYNRYCNDLNYKIAKSEFSINDIFMVAPVLEKVLPDIAAFEQIAVKITKDVIRKFIVAFCKSCEKLSVGNTVDNAYIYYTIKNIMTLEYSDLTTSVFSKLVIDNICTTIVKMTVLEKEYNVKEGVL